MEQRTKLLIGAGVIVVILLIITAVFFISKSSKTTPKPTTLENLTTVRDDGAPAATSNPVITTDNATTKMYTSSSFSMRYPKDWGILTCSNSSNLELDPTSSVDSKDVICSESVKPITILVSKSQGSCKAGKKTWTDGQTDYRWCVNMGQTYLDITHRVSAGGFKATSKTDYSGAVEQLIRTLAPATSGS